METQTKCACPVFSIKEFGEKGEFSGYASTFGGEPDSYGDVIAKGAYTKTLADHRERGAMPKMFWQHSHDEPIGKWLEAKEDDHGLYVEGKLNMGVQRGREAFELLREKDIDGLSIGYRTVEQEKMADGVYLLKEIQIREISIVSIGANASSLVSDVKAAREVMELKEKFAAGDRLTEREFEKLVKGTLGLSNSQAERAARVHLKGQGEPAIEADESLEFLKALSR